MIAYIFISIFVIIYAIGTIYVVKHRKKYNLETNFLMSIITYLIFEGIYTVSFNLSAEKSFNISSALVLWIISILSRIISIGHFSSLHNIELIKNSKIRLLSMMSYIFMYGIIISQLLYPNSFTITNPGGGLTFTTATPGSNKLTTFSSGNGNIQFTR